MSAASTVLILGPSLDNVIEPFPDAIPAVAAVAGKRSIAFDEPATVPGGTVRLTLQPAADPADVLPMHVYAIFLQPVESVPAAADRTPEWFFKAPGALLLATDLTGVDAAGKFTITVPGVKPSLSPYFVQTILEFPA